MRKPELEKKVAELEKRVQDLEARPVYLQPIVVPLPAPHPYTSPYPYGVPYVSPYGQELYCTDQTWPGDNRQVYSMSSARCSSKIYKLES